MCNSAELADAAAVEAVSVLEDDDLSMSDPIESCSESSAAPTFISAEMSPSHTEVGAASDMAPKQALVLEDKLALEAHTATRTVSKSSEGRRSSEVGTCLSPERGQQEEQGSTCVVCRDVFHCEPMAICSGSSTHKICQDCFGRNAETEFDNMEADPGVARQRFLQYGGFLPCPCRPVAAGGCDGLFSEQTIAAMLDNERYGKYMALCRTEIRADEQRKATEWVHKMAAILEKDIPGISKEVLERQLKSALPGARQCGRCGVGPVMHQGCDDLAAHHGQMVGTTRIDNCCKSCGWFEDRIDFWPPWDGKLRSSPHLARAEPSPSVAAPPPKADESIAASTPAPPSDVYISKNCLGLGFAVRATASRPPHRATSDAPLRAPTSPGSACGALLRPCHSLTGPLARFVLLGMSQHLMCLPHRQEPTDRYNWDLVPVRA